jgi:hypothetical protein
LARHHHFHTHATDRSFHGRRYRLLGDDKQRNWANDYSEHEKRQARVRPQAEKLFSKTG